MMIPVAPSCVPPPPPLLPVADAAPSSSPVALTPQEKHLRREIMRLDREERERANARRYFRARGPEHMEALLEKQRTEWQTLVELEMGNNLPAKVTHIANTQLRILTDFLQEPILIHDPEIVKEALVRYTRDELNMLLIIYQETYPEFSKDEPYVTALEEKGLASEKVRKLYLEDYKSCWESAFIQCPELGKSIADEIEMRVEEGIVVRYKPRPYSQEEEQKQGVPSVTEQKADLLADLAAKLSGILAKPKAPYQTLRRKTVHSTGSTPAVLTAKLKPVGADSP